MYNHWLWIMVACVCHVSIVVFIGFAPPKCVGCMYSMCVCVISNVTLVNDERVVIYIELVLLSFRVSLLHF